MSEFSNGFHLNDVFQCEFLAFYLAEMFKDTLCRKITYYLINNFSIWSMIKNVFNNIYEKKSLEIMLTIFVITIVRKELFEIILTTQQLSFLHSYILCKIVVYDQSTIKTYLKTYLKRK